MKPRLLGSPRHGPRGHGGDCTLFTQQADKPLDPEQLAAVQRIRARIEERASKTASGPPAAYNVTIPNTTVSYGMAPVPAGEFLMGSAGSDGKADEQPQHKVRVDAFWMQTHEVTWDAYLMFMFADQAKEREHPDAVVDALSRPTAPAPRDELRPRQQRLSGDQHDPARREQVRAVAEREDRRVLPPADRGRVGVRVPRGDHDRHRRRRSSATTRGSRRTQPLPSFTDGTYHKIGTKKPNAWGLYDMLGNVMEWTLDQYAPYTAAAAENPWVKSTTPYPHAVRGGSWNDDEDGCGVHGPCAVRCRLEEAGSATAQEHLVHDRRAVAWLPPRPPRHAAERRRDVSRLEQRRRAGSVLT